MQNIQRHKGPTVQTGVRPLRWKDSKTRGGTSVFAQNTWHLGLCETAIKHKGLVGAAESCCAMGYLHEKLLMEREEAITSSVYSVLRKPALHLVLQVWFSSALPPARPIPVFNSWSHIVPGRRKSYLLKGIPFLNGSAKTAALLQASPAQRPAGLAKATKPRFTAALLLLLRAKGSLVAVWAGTCSVGTAHPVLLTGVCGLSQMEPGSPESKEPAPALWGFIKHPTKKFSKYASVGLTFPVLFEMLMGRPVIYNKGTGKEGKNKLALRVLTCSFLIFSTPFISYGANLSYQEHLFAF